MAAESRARLAGLDNKSAQSLRVYANSSEGRDASSIPAFSKTLNHDTKSGAAIRVEKSTEGRPCLMSVIFILPNVQDEPRPWLARLVLLGARDVTAMVVGSGALLGGFFIRQTLHQTR
jgi:hypothetical protein